MQLPLIDAKSSEIDNNTHHKRRDCIAIKNRLIKDIDEKEYIETMNSFFQGLYPKKKFDEKMRSILITPESRTLHNMLMSSILYNAHFSVSPPTNAGTSLLQSSDDSQPYKQKEAGRTYLINSKSSMESYGLPSIDKLASRIKIILSETDIDSVDIAAARQIYNSVLSFIFLLLFDCLNSKNKTITDDDNKNKQDCDNDQKETDESNQNQENDQSKLIDIRCILNVIDSNSIFSEIVEQNSLDKYRSFQND